MNFAHVREAVISKAPEAALIGHRLELLSALMTAQKLA